MNGGGLDKAKPKLSEAIMSIPQNLYYKEKNVQGA